MEKKVTIQETSLTRKRESLADKTPRDLWKDDRLNTITPTSGLDLLIRQAVARNSSSAAAFYFFDEDGKPISPPASPLRRSIQPLENMADRMRQKRRSWYDPDDDDHDRPAAESRLLALPTELQFCVITYLGLSDIERLRRTSRYYRFLLSPEYVRALFGGQQGLASQLTGHCQRCLETPGRSSLILQLQQQQQQPNGAPLSSKCFQCSVHERELKIGVVRVAGGRTAQLGK
ncbi:hypothetical protein TruAng_002045 [Truncatella angustata]|nr:hypothetical protein TruAng_002045 [Truncatella angustata]